MDITNITREQLIEDYKTETTKGLGRKYGISLYRMTKLLRSHNIPVKSHLENSRLANNKPKPIRKGLEHAYKCLEDYDWLYEHRIDKKMSKEDIAVLA